MAIVMTLAKGQVVIPARMRKKYQIKPGTEMQIIEYNGVICLIPPVEDPLESACGFLPPRPSLPDKLARKRKKESR